MNFRNWTRTACTIAVLASFGAVNAQTSALAQRAKLVPIDPLGGQQLGASCAVNQLTAVIGSPLDKHTSVYGSAYIYDLSLPDRGAYWELIPNGVVGDGLFGNSVGVSGDTIVVGAYHDDTDGNWSGSAFVFERRATQWFQVTHFHASDAAIGAEFGNAVAISGDVIVVGARGASNPLPDCGAAYVFERTARGWIETAKLTASDAIVDGQFGWSVASDGQRIAIGALSAKDAGVSSGAVYIFERVHNAWTQTAKLFDPLLPTGAQYGRSLDLMGDVLAVGAANDAATSTVPGTVYVYRHTLLGWSMEARMTPRNSGPFDMFGASVSLRDGWLAVGAPLADLNGADSGAVYFYRRTPLPPPPNGGPTTHKLAGTGTGTGPFGITSEQVAEWELNGVVASNDLDVANQFGASVALFNGNLVVGAPGAICFGQRCGASYVFESWSAGGFGGAYCFGDSRAANCPCGNPSAVGSHAGCANSRGLGGLLGVMGSRSVAKDDLVCVATEIVPSQVALLRYARHAVAGGKGVPFNDGLLCLGAPAFDTDLQMIDAFGHATWGPHYAGSYGWQPGDTWHFQVFYHDVGRSPCGTGMNSSNAFEITFIP